MAISLTGIDRKLFLPIGQVLMIIVKKIF